MIDRDVDGYLLGYLRSHGDWVTEEYDMPEQAKWNTTGSVQIGDSRLSIDRFETSVNLEQELSAYVWNEEMRKARAHIQIEGPLEMTDVGKDLFDTLRSELSFTWSIVQPWTIHPLSPSKPSKQTRAFYRVRARAWDRQKVIIHAHKRKYRRR